MIDGNLSLVSTPNQQSYSAMQMNIANAVPLGKPRVVEPISHNSRSKEYVQRQSFREIQAKNLAPSTATSTENFIKAFSILAPVYSHNEAKTKYDMISQIGMKNLDIREKVNALA